MNQKNEKCPCQSDLTYSECCLPYISGAKLPHSAEALMRSRFSAFALLEMDYVKHTTDPQVLNKIDFRANSEWAKQSDFYKLEIIQSGEEGNKGSVEFKAYFRNKSDGSEHVHHEFSRFRKQSGRWYFRDGRVQSEET